MTWTEYHTAALEVRWSACNNTDDDTMNRIVAALGYLNERQHRRTTNVR